MLKREKLTCPKEKTIQENLTSKKYSDIMTLFIQKGGKFL